MYKSLGWKEIVNKLQQSCPSPFKSDVKETGMWLKVKYTLANGLFFLYYITWICVAVAVISVYFHLILACSWGSCVPWGAISLYSKIILLLFTLIFQIEIDTTTTTSETVTTHATTAESITLSTTSPALTESSTGISSTVAVSTDTSSGIIKLIQCERNSRITGFSITATYNVMKTASIHSLFSINHEKLSKAKYYFNEKN